MDIPGPNVNEPVAMRLATAFRRHGVEIIFGQSIPSSFFLASPQAGIRQATYRAENAGAIIADGYARISGRTEWPGRDSAGTANG